jgi:hypothetical protein
MRSNSLCECLVYAYDIAHRVVRDDRVRYGVDYPDPLLPRAVNLVKEMRVVEQTRKKGTQ